MTEPSFVAEPACRSCGALGLEVVLSLGKMPLANALLTAEQLNPLFTRGQLELVPGVLRAQGRELLARMGKLRQ